MATFSTNQTRQLYVANANTETQIVTNNAKTHMYLTQVGAGGPVRSDLIDVKNILWAKATKADKMAREPKSVIVSLDETVNGGEPIVGQDYILRINFRQYASLGDQDTYVKHGAVRAFKNMDASGFYKAMVLSLVKNFSRELTQLLQFSLVEEGNTHTAPITTSTKESTLSGKYIGILIDEIPQTKEWSRGVKSIEPVYFDVIPTTVMEAGEEVTWGKTEATDPEAKIGNGYDIADLEYFCMGERGDVYRGIGWPNTIHTEYLVDPKLTYDVIDIHYAYVGSNESVQKSEKDLTIVCPTGTGAELLTAINEATGLTLEF